MTVTAGGMADMSVAIDELRHPTAATELFVAALAQAIDRVMWPGSDEICWLTWGGVRVAAIVNHEHGVSVERLRSLTNQSKTPAGARPAGAATE